jgi:hypothetical protein
MQQKLLVSGAQDTRHQLPQQFQCEYVQPSLIQATTDSKLQHMYLARGRLHRQEGCCKPGTFPAIDPQQQLLKNNLHIASNLLKAITNYQ